MAGWIEEVNMDRFEQAAAAIREAHEKLRLAGGLSDEVEELFKQNSLGLRRLESDVLNARAMWIQANEEVPS